MQLQDANASYSSSNVTLTTTSETVVATTPLLRSYRNSAIVMIWAYANLTLGTNTTTVTMRVRRGTTTSDTLINEANADAIQTAAGSIEHYAIMAAEQLLAEQVLQYCFTLTQAGASANGTSVESCIGAIVI